MQSRKALQFFYENQLFSGFTLFRKRKVAIPETVETVVAKIKLPIMY